MYMTCSPASPCVKTASPRPYCTMVFGTPADSRNACALNTGVAFAAPLEGFAALLRVSMPLSMTGARPHELCTSEQTSSPFGRYHRGPSERASRHRLSATPTPYRGGFVMTLTLPGLILLIVIAAICGAVGKALAGGSQGGLVVSIALGFIGALFGPWVAGQLHLDAPLMLNVTRQP